MNTIDIRNIPNDELRKRILDGFKKNGIYKVHYETRDKMVDSFMSYTKLGRQYIIDYYSPMEKTKSKMNWINKTRFERDYFYIGGSDALIAMMLLGFKVNEYREANVTLKSIEPPLEQSELSESCFFRENNLKSKDINTSWNEWFS